MSEPSNGKFRKAATLVLIRESADSLEIYMTERPGTEDFPGLHVFPGGKVDEVDHEVEAYCAGLTESDANRALNLDVGGLGYWVTAIRECFEEAGVLMAQSEGDLLNSPQAELSYRSQLHARTTSLATLCKQESLMLATDRLHYFSHWITPAAAPRRYDTRFFVCDMPEGQLAVHDDSEVASAEWISPQAALERFERGEWLMIDPTLRTLETLARYASTSHLFADIGRRSHLPVVTSELQEQGMQIVPPLKD